MSWLLEPFHLTLLGGGMLLLLSIVLAAFWLAHANRKLQKSYRERERLDLQLKIANATLEHKVVLRTQQLQESEARFRQMFECHASPMMLIEPDSGDIVNANHAAEVFYGYSIEQMKAMNISRINVTLPDDTNLPASPDSVSHRLASGVVRSVEVHSSSVDVAGR